MSSASETLALMAGLTEVKTPSMFDNLVIMLIADAIPSDVLAIGFPDRLGPLRPFNLLPTVIALSFSPF